jgi:hypothetical protein
LAVLKQPLPEAAITVPGAIVAMAIAIPAATGAKRPNLVGTAPKFNSLFIIALLIRLTGRYEKTWLV